MGHSDHFKLVVFLRFFFYPTAVYILVYKLLEKNYIVKDNDW